MILTQDGRIAVARALANEQFFMAWGEGDPAWDTTPVQASNSESSLVAEVGRRKATFVGYCEPDAGGSIVTPEQVFMESETPTKYLFLRFIFGFDEATEFTIREIGIFLYSQVDPALPPGQEYFTPDQVTEPGALLLVERLSAVPRSPSIRTRFEQVFTV